MKSTTLWPVIAVVIAIVAVAGPAVAEVRTWTDSTGEHQVEAEFLSYNDGKARLRRTDGKEISIAIDRLSSADRAYLRKLIVKKPARVDREPVPSARPAAAEESAKDAVLAAAEKFYGDLRTSERETASAMLTEAAQAIAKEGTSPLTGLPTPDEHDRGIRLGRARIERNAGRSAGASSRGWRNPKDNAAPPQ